MESIKINSDAIELIEFNSNENTINLFYRNSNKSYLFINISLDLWNDIKYHNKKAIEKDSCSFNRWFISNIKNNKKHNILLNKK